MAATGKIAEVLFENAIETYEHQLQMLDLVDVFKPSSGDMQNAGNYVWRPVQQHAPVIAGWDMTGLETDIIEETYPAVLGVPNNDIFSQRADDLRDMQFWERRGKQSGLKQATTLNKDIASMVVNTGSMYYRTNATSGFDAIGQAQALMNERQVVEDSMRYMVLNDRDNLKFAGELAGRGTVKGRPETAWATGQIGSGVAGFDLYAGSFIPTLAGGAIADTTTTAAVSHAPEGGSVNSATGVVTNVDYREGTIPVVASGAYVVGDRVQFDNGATPVESIGLADKTASGQPMTFVITEIVNGTTVKVFPKPIALDDAALSVLEKAYANINTQITLGATMVKLNITTAKANIFWTKNSIEVTGGDAPVQLLNEFGGMKVISSTMSNGQNMYLAYDGDIAKMSFTCRLFTWYSVTNSNPSANGIFQTF